MFLENIFMKKCLKCGVEYQDDDIFCPVCGEKLTATNVCQRCGKPVSAEETYCRHCGYKIEKEIKCEQCGANIEEGAKFCPQCGAKVKEGSNVCKYCNSPIVRYGRKFVMTKKENIFQR